MPRGLARDHTEKRAALRRGAAAHFATHGYDRASMASVAQACGVSKALIYHYYDSKEALLFDLDGVLAADERLGAATHCSVLAGQSVDVGGDVRLRPSCQANSDGELPAGVPAGRLVITGAL